MSPEQPIPELMSLTVQVLGTCLFCSIFAFLWKRSGVVYFGLWSLAWLAFTIAVIVRALYTDTRIPAWGLASALMIFVYCVLLLAAARAGLSGSKANWRTPLRSLLFFPIFLLFAYLLTHSGRPTVGVRAMPALLLAGIYFYNFAVIGGYTGPAGKCFRISLLCLCLLFLQQAIGFLYFHFNGISEWAHYRDLNRLGEFGLGAILTFFALAMWIEIQNDRIAAIAGELDRVRRHSLANQDLDVLTGLLNQAALAKRMEDTAGFHGVVTVCDMDNFKEVNDRCGHLVGDETLRNIGHLLRTSIRGEDEAFRWGGDEFVILFHNQNQDVAHNRMRAIDARLHGFNVRGYGALAISFSWGIAEAHGRPLRETLDEADQRMYEFKRERKKA